jgi:Abnormal spindle-like microcephaly-assoc'd, ASPM-SPD-2-Hydin
MIRSGPRLALLATTLVVLLGACGGGGESESPEAFTGETETADSDNGDNGNNGNNGDDNGNNGDDDGNNGDNDGDNGDNGDNGDPSTSPSVSFGPIFLDPRELVFGRVPVGETAQRSLLLTNSPDVARTLVALQIGGDSASDFAIAGGDCTEGREVQPEETCTVVLEFTPTAAGERRASFSFETEPGFGRSVRLRGGNRIDIGPDAPTITDPPAADLGD